MKVCDTVQVTVWQNTSVTEQADTVQLSLVCLSYNCNGRPEVRHTTYIRINLVQLLCDRPWGGGEVKLRGPSKPSLHLNIWSIPQVGEQCGRHK